MRPGPTGDFPQGKIDETDEGSLVIAVSTKEDIIMIDFGKSLTWIAMPKQEAVQFALTILRSATEIKDDPS